MKEDIPNDPNYYIEKDLNFLAVMYWLSKNSVNESFHVTLDENDGEKKVVRLGLVAKRPLIGSVLERCGVITMKITV